jgi:hypothetical protein
MPDHGITVNTLQAFVDSKSIYREGYSEYCSNYYNSPPCPYPSYMAKEFKKWHADKLSSRKPCPYPSDTDMAKEWNRGFNAWSMR